MIGSRGRLLVALGIANTKVKTSSRETDVKAGKNQVFSLPSFNIKTNNFRYINTSCYFQIFMFLGSETTNKKPVEILESAEVIIDATAGSESMCNRSGEISDVSILPVESEGPAPNLLENFLHEFPVESDVAVPNNIMILNEDLLDGLEKNIVSEIAENNNINYEIIDYTVKSAELASDSDHSQSDVDSDAGSLYQPQQSASSPSEESETEVSEVNLLTEILVGEPTRNKRKRKGQRNKGEWTRKKNSKLRLLGEAYVGFQKEPENGKYKQTLKKKKKTLGPRCPGHSVRCKRGGPRQSFECNEIDDDQREVLFRTFWAKSSWESKHTYIVENAVPEKPKYSNDDLINSRRKNTFRFYFTVEIPSEEKGINKIRKQVCKQMFLNTLSIGEKQLRSWTLKNKKETDEACSSAVPYDPPVSKNLESWFNSLPKMESHYCRSSTSKLYLEPIWTSVREMHRVYQNDNNIKISWHTFQRIYNKMNLSIYAPKKDQCNECTMHKNGTLDEESFQKHIDKMKDANAAKESDKCIALTDKDIKCYTVDLQAVLLSPRLNAAANYYKTKLKVHNQVYYNQATRDVSCYVWHEVEGGLESDVFATIATSFIMNEIENHSPLKKIIIWSDGCSYQNRNVKLSNALLDICIQKDILIEQKYLEVGHTHMEVDSVHSTIEAKLRNRRQVFVPADYIDIIETARIKNPYKTHYLSHDDFLKFDTSIYCSIRPGSKKGDPCVNDVVAYQYTPKGIINYKLSMHDEWTELPQRAKKRLEVKERPKLYNGPCPIENSKYLHLQELKQLIPQDYREFYTNLPYK